MMKLKKLATNPPNTQQHQTKMHNVAAITLPIALKEHIERDWICLTMFVPDTSATPQLVENGRSGEGTDREADIRHHIGNPRQRQDDSTDGRQHHWHAQIAPQRVQRGATPRQQGADTHRQDQDNGQGANYLLIEWRANRHSLATKRG